jgi:hypothetical protein
MRTLVGAAIAVIAICTNIAAGTAWGQQAGVPAMQAGAVGTSGPGHVELQMPLTPPEAGAAFFASRGGASE